MLSVAQEYILILANYEDLGDIEEKLKNGIDITDELYERLCVHDELAAEAFLNGQPS